MRKATIIIIGICLLWFQCIKPIISEYYYAHNEIEKAYNWDKNNDSVLLAYSLSMFRNGKYDYADIYINKLINNFSGDVTLYSVWHLKSVIDYGRGDVLGAMNSINLAHSYSPYDENINRTKEKLLNAIAQQN